MRLGVYVNIEDSRVYPLDKPEIIIGSSKTADIVITEPGISRKHVKISVVKDQYFITDQGSTNGTFINEEKLAVGERVEFTTFFPVRLGGGVLLNLISDDTPEVALRNKTSTGGMKIDVMADDATRAIHYAGRPTIQNKNIGNSAKKNETADRGSFAKILVPILAILILGIGYYLNEPSNGDMAITDAQSVHEIVTPPEAPQAKPVSPKHPSEISKEKLQSYFSDLKCTTPEELEICNSSNIFKSKSNGVLRVGTSFIFLIAEGEWLNRATKNTPANDSLEEIRAKGGKSLNEIYNVAFLELLTEVNLSSTKSVDTPLYFVFYRTGSDSNIVIDKVFTLNSSNLHSILKIYSENKSHVQTYGFKTILDVENYFHRY